MEDLGGTHGPLLLATSIFLIFRARNEVAAPAAQPSILGFAGLIACALAWLVTLRAGIEDLQLLFFPPLLWLAVFAAFGWSVARMVLLPIGVLVTALPAWGHLAGPLQFITTHAVGLLAAVAGIPVYIERNFVTIPEGVFEIAGGCSGVHYLVVAIALGAIHGEMTGASWRRRAILLGSLMGLALFLNWIRVFTIVVAGHLTSMQHSLITHGHYWYGWTLFAIGIVIFMWIASRSDPVVDTYRRPAAAPVALRPPAYLLTLGLLVGLPGVVYLIDFATPPDGRELQVNLPSGHSPWVGPVHNQDSSWTPEFAGAHQQAQSVYIDSHGNPLTVTGVVFRSQRQGAELVGEATKLFGSVEVTTQAEHVIDSRAGRFRETIIVGPAGARYVVWSVYDIGGRQFVVPFFSQLWYGVRSLIGAPTSVLLSVRAACEPTCDAGRSRLDAFLSSMGGSVLAALTAPPAPAGDAARSAEIIP